MRTTFHARVGGRAEVSVGPTVITFYNQHLYLAAAGAARAAPYIYIYIYIHI